jgi:hypothetical protein
VIRRVDPELQGLIVVTVVNTSNDARTLYFKVTTDAERTAIAMRLFRFSARPTRRRRPTSTSHELIAMGAAEETPLLFVIQAGIADLDEAARYVDRLVMAERDSV